MTLDKKYDFQDRLIAFAGDIILFIANQNKHFVGQYLYNQIMRSSGSAALNFAESQGSFTDKDYLNKLSIALKELKETEVNLRIMEHINFGAKARERLQTENLELIKILVTIIKNRRNSIKR